MANIEALEQIETPLIKVPFEALKRDARDRKGIVDQLSKISSQLTAKSTEATTEQAVQMLTDVEAQLQDMIAKHEQSSARESANARRCVARAAHLQTISESASVVEWSRHRLPRLIVDHLLRHGHWGAAQAVVSAAGCEDLVDVHVFRDSQAVLQSLAAHDCGPALAWCDANAARLKKFRSALPFHLHLQQYVELVRGDRCGAALEYARTHLVHFAADDLPLFKRALALLVFARGPRCARYAALLRQDRWSALVRLFLQDLFRIHNMSPLSPLEVHMQAGLTALKCPLSYEDGCTKEDPLHLPHMKQLAEKLPWAKHVTSKLVCSVTKTVMNDSNPPMVLPNGYVYSKEGLDEIVSAQDGRVVCPVTQQSYTREECVQAYIL